MSNEAIRVAVVQAAPRLFDKSSAFERIVRYTGEAAAQGAKLVVFPEAFVSGYPRGLTFGARVGSRADGGRADWQRHWDSAIELPGTDAGSCLATSPGRRAFYLIVGVIERERVLGRSTLYNTAVYFGPDGRLLGKHRKLVPTGSERLLWGQGDGSTLTVIETPFGRIGGLICWENYMPLARMALYGKGVDIWVAPTADSRDTWQAAIRHIACEGRCFVLSANQFATKASYPEDLYGYDEIGNDPEVLCRGGSAIVGPLGDYVRPPLYGEEGLLVANLDLAEVPRSRFDMDVTGHYGRPDVFRLDVNEESRAIVRYGAGEQQP